MKSHENRDVTIKTGPAAILVLVRLFAFFLIAYGIVAFLDKMGHDWTGSILLVMLFNFMDNHLGSYKANQWLARRWKWLRQEEPVRG